MSGTASLIYRPGQSLLHRANPLTKLSLLLWVLTLAFVLPWWLLWAATFLLVVGARLPEVGAPILRRFILLSAPFTVAVLIFHGLIMPRPDFVPVFTGAFFSGPGWLRFSPSGLDHAALLSGRIALILAAALLFSATTHPATLLHSFDAAHWPPGLAYLLAAPLLLIEDFSARTRAIRDAQGARGMNLGGSLRNRIRALTMLVVPLVTAALSDAHERGDVLTARGFRALPQRSLLNPPPDSPRQSLLRKVLLGLALLQIGAAPWI
jgi:energy-coupling factor transport system permease protein